MKTAPINGQHALCREGVENFNRTTTTTVLIPQNVHKTLSASKLR